MVGMCEIHGASHVPERFFSVSPPSPPFPASPPALTLGFLIKENAGKKKSDFSAFSQEAPARGERGKVPVFPEGKGRNSYVEFWKAHEPQGRRIPGIFPLLPSLGKGMEEGNKIRKCLL